MSRQRTHPFGCAQQQVFSPHPIKRDYLCPIPLNAVRTNCRSYALPICALCAEKLGAFASAPMWQMHTHVQSGIGIKTRGSHQTTQGLVNNQQRHIWHKIWPDSDVHVVWLAACLDIISPANKQIQYIHSQPRTLCCVCLCRDNSIVCTGECIHCVY